MEEKPWKDGKRWVDNRERPTCVLCRKSFTFARRRHHCRLCGEVFCQECSAHRVDVGELKNVRICDICYEIKSFDPSVRPVPIITRAKSVTLYSPASNDVADAESIEHDTEEEGEHLVVAVPEPATSSKPTTTTTSSPTPPVNMSLQHSTARHRAPPTPTPEPANISTNKVIARRGRSRHGLGKVKSRGKPRPGLMERVGKQVQLVMADRNKVAQLKKVGSLVCMTPLFITLLSYEWAILSWLCSTIASYGATTLGLDLSEMDSEVMTVAVMVVVPLLLVYWGYMSAFQAPLPYTGEEPDDDKEKGLAQEMWTDIKRLAVRLRDHLSLKGLIEICYAPAVTYKAGEQIKLKSARRKAAAQSGVGFHAAHLGKTMSKHQSSVEEQKSWLASAEGASEKLWILATSADGWTKQQAVEGIHIWTKCNTRGRQTFKCHVTMKCSADSLFDLLLDDRQSLWNRAMLSFRVVDTLGDTADVSHRQCSYDATFVLLRDYVEVRSWQARDNGVYQVSTVGTQHSAIPSHLKGSVRGQCGTSGAAIFPIDGKPNRCMLVYIMDQDPKGWLPVAIANRIIYTCFLTFLKTLRKTVKRLQRG